MKRMLFNATQAEELRVAIVDGQKLIDLDIESAAKEERKSNIYKAVITRIEPSLEAAFVDYGSERHGFLPFKEIARSFFAGGTDAGKTRIQDALSVGQELIVQVEKDERGTKGAALTTYVSLAGRYLVLMPNNPRGGGVSRRVEGDERAELREAMDQLAVPSGMSLIARTAAIGRSAEELQWDLDYLLQLWRAIEGAAKEQSGAFLIYQEGSLVIRAIRDYFQPDVGEILIDTDDVFEQARQFMAHVMPGNVAKVKRYSDDVPLFSRFQIEHQIESAYARQVNLPSGGAIVIDHTEALVSVDVNSGRATKGADIEETALKTNLEAAEEIARQLRLRDLGGLIVIDFIDMESQKGQREVETRLRDALHYDRARVQTSKISRFGLLELSRQRLRPALAETSYIPCPRCNGTGHIRSTESSALHILRILEEEAMKDNTGAVHVQVPVDVATFLLNEKRSDIARIELRHKILLIIVPNRHMETPHHEIVRLRHDQLNQEDIALASYQMVSAPLEEDERKTESSAKPVRAEAAVKGIAPSQPAPNVAPVDEPAATVPAQPGFLARLFAWLRKDSTPATPDAPAKTATKRSSEQEGRSRGDGRRGGRNANKRDGNSPRGERAEADNTRNGRQKNAQKTPDAPRKQDVAEDDDNASRSSSRGRRGGRGQPRGQQKADETLVASAVAVTDEAPVVAAETTGEEPIPAIQMPSRETSELVAAADETSGSGRKRRRGRGRRGGRGENAAEQTEELGNAQEAEDAPDAPDHDSAAATALLPVVASEAVVAVATPASTHDGAELPVKAVEQPSEADARPASGTTEPVIDAASETTALAAGGAEPATPAPGGESRGAPSAPRDTALAPMAVTTTQPEEIAAQASIQADAGELAADVAGGEATLTSGHADTDPLPTPAETEPVPPLVVAPVEPPLQHSLPLAPVETNDDAPATDAPTADARPRAPIDVGAALADSGLVMIETDRSKVSAVEVADEPASAPLGRAPRPVQSPPDEPMVQIETRK